ncbi:hypothetical protein AAFF_G00392690 [Aldrovandia affinis]|uniref:Uncharacterized protein n=1 Tax=Aldrovandia affinis TaxID=143900 RepID=A0AAD7SEB4_9TELE|nr:hypothetical protein AAFF_G00392690 [Aldrovandia affinis]
MHTSQCHADHQLPAQRSCSQFLPTPLKCSALQLNPNSLRPQLPYSGRLSHHVLPDGYVALNNSINDHLQFCISHLLFQPLNKIGSWGDLGQDGAKAFNTGDIVQNKLASRVKSNKGWGVAESLLQGVEGPLLVWSPVTGIGFLKESVKRGSNGCKASHEAPVV